MGILQSSAVKGLENLNLFVLAVVCMKCIDFLVKTLGIRAELRILEAANAGTQGTRQLSHQS